MRRIAKFGFKKIGSWKKDKETLFINLEDFINVNDIVFAFTEENKILYIGLTDENTKTFLKSLINPSDIDYEKEAIQKLLLEELNNHEVEIFALRNRKFFGLAKRFSVADINEIIQKIDPPWNAYDLKNRMKNIIGNDRISLIHSKKMKEKLEEEKLEKEKNQKKAELKKEETKKEKSYIFTLGKSYYERGFFNLKTSYSNLVGDDKTELKVFLVGKDGKEETIVGKINRTANSGKTARIVGNKALKIWFEENCEIKSKLKITFISKKKIKLETT